MTTREFFSKTENILKEFDSFASLASIDKEIVADHIGYKCGGTPEFESLRAMLESGSSFIYQSIISKRRIAIVRLGEPLQTIGGPIWFLELSDQKPDGSQKSGFDHLEFFPKTGKPEDIVDILARKNIIAEKADRPHHVTYDLTLASGFKIRIEPEALIQKIIREEINQSG